MHDPLPPAPTIRRARPDEAEALLGLWRDAGATASATDTAEDVGRALTLEWARVLVAEWHGHLIGSLIAGFDGWRGNLYRLAVRPEQRRRGVARALLAEGERWLASQGAKRITALVEQDHRGAIAFWQAAGYRYDERLVRFVGNLSAGEPSQP
jgi:ribosomal protein S18 acetylase RimI-like enzyme